MFIDDSYNNQSRCIISRELLALLNVIMDEKEEMLLHLIKKSVGSHLSHEIAYNKSLNKHEIMLDAQDTVRDFFSMLELYLRQAMQEKYEKRIAGKNLLPALECLDRTFDGDTVRLSAARATSNTSGSKRSAKKIFCKELIKNWNPHKGQLVH